MHTNIATPRQAANHHLGIGHMDAHIIFPSSCSSQYILWRVIQHVNYIQIQYTTEWRSKDELISDTLLWLLTHGCGRVGWPARTYLHQLCVDIEYSLEDLPEVMDDRNRWRERIRDIHAVSTTWCWWWFLSNINKLYSIMISSISSNYMVSSNSW